MLKHCNLLESHTAYESTINNRINDLWTIIDNTLSTEDPDYSAKCLQVLKTGFPFFTVCENDDHIHFDDIATLTVTKNGDNITFDKSNGHHTDRYFIRDYQTTQNYDFLRSFEPSVIYSGKPIQIEQTVFTNNTIPVNFNYNVQVLVNNTDITNVCNIYIDKSVASELSQQMFYFIVIYIPVVTGDIQLNITVENGI